MNDNQNEIASLTREVENGNGCALRDFFQDIPIGERMQILRQMDQNHLQQRSSDPHLPRLEFYGDSQFHGVALQREQDTRPVDIYEGDIRVSNPTTRPDGTISSQTTIRENCRTPERLP